MSQIPCHDIPTSLRKLADDLDLGSIEGSMCVVVLGDNYGVEVFGLGRETESDEAKELMSRGIMHLEDLEAEE